MSNAMRSGKRWFAGAAAGALVAGLMPFVAVAASSSANAATVTGTVSPVRVTYAAPTDSTKQVTTYSTLGWQSSVALTTNETVEVAFNSSTNASAQLCVSEPAKIELASCANTVANQTYLMDIFDDTAAVPAAATAAGGLTAIGISATGTGTFSGTAKSYKAGVVQDTVNWSFTTTGAAATFTLSPASQSTTVGTPAAIEVDVLDANGNPTQLVSTERIAVTATNSATLAPTSPLEYTDITAVDNEFTVTLAAAGSTTVTATPQGTWPVSATAQTATVSVSGSIDEDAIATIVAAAPANAINAGTQPGSATAQVPTGTSTVTVKITGSSNNAAGDVIRLQGVANVGDATPKFADVTLNADKEGTATFTLSGDAIKKDNTLTVTQRKADNTAVTGVELTVTQTSPDISTSTVVVAPSGSNIRQIGATTPVSVTVVDQFKNPVSGAVVSSFRGVDVTGTFLASSTTNASGVATVNVSGLSTVVNNTTENYSFKVQAAGLTTVDMNQSAGNGLSITYTTSGAITAMTITPNSGGATNNTGTPAPTSYPAIAVPKAATGGKIDGSVSAATSAASTGLVTGTPGVWTTFKVQTTPLNSVTITAPEGVKVSATDPTASTTTIWSSGTQTATIQGNNTALVYVWATKTGLHDLTFTSNELTTTAKLRVVNTPGDAYNIALSPTATSIPTGGIGSVTLSVTDVFGNPVQTDDTSAVTAAITGEALLAGFLPSSNFTTNAAGQATVTFIGGNAAGQAVLTATPKTGTTLAQWKTPYTPPTGAPAPVVSAAAEIGVGEAPGDASIVIAGEREGRRIVVEGVTTGLAEGTVVRPWIRFPGQTSYTQGTAQRTVAIVDQDQQIGEFAWQRRTGKRTAVIFRTEDGTVSSTRIIIPAR